MFVPATGDPDCFVSFKETALDDVCGQSFVGRCPPSRVLGAAVEGVN